MSDRESDSNANHELIKPSSFQPPEAGASTAPARSGRPLYWIVGALLFLLLAGFAVVLLFGGILAPVLAALACGLC